MEMDTNNHSDESYSDYDYYEDYYDDYGPSCSVHGLYLIDGTCSICEENLRLAEEFLETQLEPHLPTTVIFNAGDRGGKVRKDELTRRKLVNCGHCPYHRRENNTLRKRNPHDKRRPWRD